MQWRPLLLMSLTMLRHTPLVEVNQATVSLVIIDNSIRYFDPALCEGKGSAQAGHRQGGGGDQD